MQILIITGDAMGRPLIEALDPARTDTSSLGVVASGAALFSPVIKDAFLEAFPGLLVSDSIARPRPVSAESVSRPRGRRRWVVPGSRRGGTRW